MTSIIIPRYGHAAAGLPPNASLTANAGPMGISSEASRLFAVLYRSQPLRTFNRSESTLQLCIGVLGVLGTIAVLASLRNRDSLKGIDHPSSPDDEKVEPSDEDYVSADIPIKRTTTPPPAYEQEHIDSASSSLIEEMADSIEYVEHEAVASPSAGSRFRRRMKKTLSFGKKNRAR